MRADRISVREKVLDNFRTRIGSNVEVLGCETAHHVAHAPAGEVGDVAFVAQACSDFARRLFHRRRFHPITVAAWPCETQRARVGGQASLPDSADGLSACRSRQARCPGGRDGLETILHSQHSSVATMNE